MTIRVCGSVTSSEKSQLTLEGTAEEMDKVRAMLMGVHWLGMHEKDGLIAVPRCTAPPEPIADPYVPPNWQTKVPPVGQCTVHDITKAERQAKPPYNVTTEVDPSEGWHSPSYYIEHLCGYGFTKERYAEQVKIMFECGFECLRSRRSHDGRFWEVWYLPGDWAAKGRLKADCIDKLSGKLSWHNRADAVVSWLCHNTSFGSLQVAAQRAAMVIDD